jgi:hypothetical protein
MKNQRVRWLLICCLLGLLGLIPPAAAQSQANQPVAAATFTAVNIRSGPGQVYGEVGLLRVGESCPIIGRDTNSGWWLIRCVSGITGWVDFTLVQATGDLGSVPLYAVSPPSAQPTPAPTPVPPPVNAGWSAVYFANREMNGAPVFSENPAQISFNWALNSPHPYVPVDYFSARYERAVSAAPGTYRVVMRMDDGARLFINDQLVLNDWRVGSWREISTFWRFTGFDRVRVEYFEDTQNAAVQFFIEGIDAGITVPVNPVFPTPISNISVPNDAWKAQYYNNTDLAGSAIVTRIDSRSTFPLDQNWGAGSPVTGQIAADFWSARWEGVFTFQGGNFDFFAESDDGVRVYIDNLLLIDAWYDGFKQRQNRFLSLGAGPHTMRVEFYERTGNAQIRVWWSPIF